MPSRFEPSTAGEPTRPRLNASVFRDAPKTEAMGHFGFSGSEALRQALRMQTTFLP